MNREEQKQEAAVKYANEQPGINSITDFNKNLCITLAQAYMQGIEWADEHPKEGFWDKEKVIEWLYDNFWDYLETDYISDFEILRKARVGDMIEDLQKAMEE